MSARTARLLAIPFALVLCALRQTVRWVGLHDSWFDAISRGLRLTAWISADIAVAVMLPVAYHLLIRKVRRPATFTVDSERTRFVAPVSPRWVGPWMIYVGWCAGQAPLAERVPDTGRVGLVTDPVLLTIAVVLLLVLLAMAPLTGRTRLTLDPTTITVRGMVLNRRLHWELLLPGGPPPPRKRASGLTVFQTPPKPTDRPIPYVLHIARYHVDAAFLADTIRHYAEHPEHRAAIGTRAELDRLVGAQAGGASG